MIGSVLVRSCCVLLCELRVKVVEQAVLKKKGLSIRKLKNRFFGNPHVNLHILMLQARVNWWDKRCLHPYVTQERFSLKKSFFCSIEPTTTDRKKQAGDALLLPAS